MAIEAILWDFGGVITSSPFDAFNDFEARRGLPKDFIRTVNRTNPDSNAWALFEALYAFIPSTVASAGAA